MQEIKQKKTKIVDRGKSVDGIVRRSNPPGNVFIKEEDSFQKRSIYFGLRMVGLATLVFVLSLGLSSIGNTVSYFNDTETSVGNKLQAGILGFNISAIADVLGKLSVARIEPETVEETSIEEEPEENVGSAEFDITVGEGDGSLPAIYSVSGALDLTNPLGCEKMDITANLGEYNHSGLFQLFSFSKISEMGEWHFVTSLPRFDTGLEPGVTCRGKIIFNAGLAGVREELVNTFSDTQEYIFEVINWGKEEVAEEIPTLLEPELIPTREESGEVEEETPKEDAEETSEEKEEIPSEEIDDTEEEPALENEDEKGSQNTPDEENTNGESQPEIIEDTPVSEIVEEEPKEKAETSEETEAAESGVEPENSEESE